MDGAGNVSGSDTISLDGTVTKRTFTGTYTMNADCTGSMTLQYSNNQSFHADLVTVNTPKEIHLVQTDGGWIFSGTLTKQDPTVATQQ